MKNVPFPRQNISLLVFEELFSFQRACMRKCNRTPIYRVTDNMCSCLLRTSFYFLVALKAIKTIMKEIQGFADGPNKGIESISDICAAVYLYVQTYESFIYLYAASCEEYWIML